MKDLIIGHLERSSATLKQVLADQSAIAALIGAAKVTSSAMHAGNKLMVAGNGGSAADAQHMVAEFVSRLTIDRPAMRAVALTTDTSILTAVANDYGYESVFSRQLEALGQKGDVFIGITTSGKPPNILKALRHCRSMGITSLLLTGNYGGQALELCDYSIVIQSAVTAHIQESHLVLEHIFCTLVERYYFGMDYFSPSSVQELVV